MTRPTRNSISILIGSMWSLCLLGCGRDVPSEEPSGAATQDVATQSLVVTASAYTSSPKETGNTHGLGAWGDKLRPGMKAIAVSRDLLEFGLTHRTTVRIDDLPGEYVVLDKMAKRWERKVDIYMGNDVAAAREWGKREVVIRWPTEEETQENDDS